MTIEAEMISCDYACNRLTNRLKYSAAVQVMDLSNSYDLILVRYSAAYPTGAERWLRKE